MKKRAFTLAEVLITLSIVGVVSTLVVPGIIRDINKKSGMTLLNSIVKSLDDAVASELMHERTQNIKATNVAKHPGSFLSERMDSTGVTDKNRLFASQYKSTKGTQLSEDFLPSKVSAAIGLKNGASIGIEDKSSEDKMLVYIDTNGQGDPNMAGVDLFVLTIQLADNENLGIHKGDIGSDNSTCASYKDKCKAGDPACCYKWAEISGFDPDYAK